ncbi:MAG: TRAP transporter small permease [Alphaproteobacteria bacterium]|nr:TRAP transporter small permease [Alphaproteobacteria bacterium]
MIRILETIGRRLAWAEAALTAFCGLLLVALLVLINVEIGARYLFNRSTLIADEYGGYLFAWIVLLGSIQALRGDRYLSMTALVDRAPPRLRNGLAAAGALIGLGVCLVVLYATLDLALTSWRFGTRSIQPSATPLFWPQAALPVGYALLSLAFAEEFCRRLVGLAPRSSPEADQMGGLG